EARPVTLDQFLLADRFTRDEGNAHDRARDLGGRIGLLVAANEGVARAGRGPALPLHVVRLEGLAEPDVGLRDQHVDGLQLSDRRGLRSFSYRSAAACQIGSEAAGTECNEQNDNAGDIHTLYYLLLRRGI